MKLIYRISTTIFCIVFITALILSSYSFYVQRSLINSQLVKKGHVLARLLSTSVVNYLISYDFYAIKMLMDPITKDSDILSVALIGPDNFIKVHTDLGMIGQECALDFKTDDFTPEDVIFREITRDQQKQYLFTSAVEIDHNRIGIIQITMSDEESLLLIESFGQKMLFLTAGVLLFAVLAAYIMSRQISNPLIELTEEINRFMMTQSAMEPGPGKSDEITVLKKNFKYMMSELQNSIEFRVKNEKMAVLGNLSSVLAHEIKNPLEPIKGSAEILKRKYPENPDVIKYTQIIQSEVSDLIIFLDSFLDVSRTNNISMQPLDINKAIKEILILLEYTFSKENFETDVKLSGGLPPVIGNSGMIKQAILNLLLNAIQAKNGDWGLIEIETRRDDDRITIRIRDHGTGVEESQREQIFLPFYSTREEGAGIGLSTSRHLIEQHGGTITIESSFGSWTEFVITLPVGETIEE